MKDANGRRVNVCPGCKEEYAMSMLRKGENCHVCIRKLADYELMVARVAKAEGQAWEPVYVPAKLGDRLPYLSRIGYDCRDYVTAFMGLFKPFSTGAKVQRESLSPPTVGGLLSSDGNDIFWQLDCIESRVPEGFTQALRVLHSHVDKLLNRAHAVGIKDGTSLLVRLNSGDLSMKEFEERTNPRSSR